MIQAIAIASLAVAGTVGHLWHTARYNALAAECAEAAQQAAADHEAERMRWQQALEGQRRAIDEQRARSRAEAEQHEQQKAEIAARAGTLQRELVRLRSREPAVCRVPDDRVRLIRQAADGLRAGASGATPGEPADAVPGAD